MRFYIQLHPMIQSHKIWIHPFLCCELQTHNLLSRNSLPPLHYTPSIFAHIWNNWVSSEQLNMTPSTTSAIDHSSISNSIYRTFDQSQRLKSITLNENLCFKTSKGEIIWIRVRFYPFGGCSSISPGISLYWNSITRLLSCISFLSLWCCNFCFHDCSKIMVIAVSLYPHCQTNIQGTCQ